jgi:hypothetical protein
VNLAQERAAARRLDLMTSMMIMITSMIKMVVVTSGRVSARGRASLKTALIYGSTVLIG